MPAVSMVASTGAYALEVAMGRTYPGYTAGEITELSGLEGCGSSALGIAAAEATAQEGNQVSYFDFAGNIQERLLPDDNITVYVRPAPELLNAYLRGAVLSATRLVVVDSVDRIFQNRKGFPVQTIAKMLKGTSTALLLLRRYPLHPDPSPWLELQVAASTRLRLSHRLAATQEEGEPTRSVVAIEFLKRKGLTKAKKPVEIILEGGRVSQERFKREKDESTSRFDREDVI
jgi:hypothetical protein